MLELEKLDTQVLDLRNTTNHGRCSYLMMQSWLTLILHCWVSEFGMLSDAGVSPGYQKKLLKV